MKRLTLNAAGIMLAALACAAHADTNFSTGAKIEALYTSFSKEYLSCWREGNQKDCSYAPKLWQGESYARGGVVHDQSSYRKTIAQKGFQPISGSVLFRGIAFQNSSKSLVRKASSHPARLNFPRNEPFDPSFCIALRAMCLSTARLCGPLPNRVLS